MTHEAQGTGPIRNVFLMARFAPRTAQPEDCVSQVRKGSSLPAPDLVGYNDLL